MKTTTATTSATATTTTATSPLFNFVTVSPEIYSQVKPTNLELEETDPAWVDSAKEVYNQILDYVKDRTEEMTAMSALGLTAILLVCSFLNIYSSKTTIAGTVTAAITTTMTIITSKPSICQWGLSCETHDPFV